MAASDTLQAAFADLPWLRQLAAQLARGDAAEADDLVQETLVRTWEREPAQPVRSPRAWFTATLRNRLRMRQRGEIRRKGREAHSAPPEPGPDPTTTLERVEVLQVLIEHVRALPEPDRAIVMGRFFDGLDATQLGRTLGLRPTTVRSRLKRALSRLRDKLDEHYRGDRAMWSLAVALPNTDPTTTTTTTATTTATTIMSQGIKTIAASTAAIAMGVGFWITQRDTTPAASPSSPSVELAATAHQAQPASPPPQSAHDRWKTARARIARLNREANGATKTPPSATPTSADHSAMLEEAREAHKEALEHCSGMVVGAITIRTTVLGAPGVGTIYESVDVVQTLGNNNDHVDCLTSAMYEFVGTPPPYPFTNVSTSTTLGRRPEGLDDDQWRDTMFESVVVAHLDDVRLCELEFGGDRMTGAVPIAMEFDRSPATIGVTIGQTPVPDAVTECIAEEARGWMFPRKFAGHTMNYTFTLPIDPAVDGIVEP